MKRFLIYALGTGLGSGFSPIAPGTAGSILALLIFYLLPLTIPGWLIVIAVTYTAGIWISGKIEAEKGQDPGLVVIDEFIGQWITLFTLPRSWAWLLGGFLLFRLFDIWKPFPVFQSQKLPGGWGIMTDDVLAGLYGLILMHLIRMMI
jgi:phosphatidylglycerophosphatase A